MEKSRAVGEKKAKKALKQKNKQLRKPKVLRVSEREDDEAVGTKRKRRDDDDDAESDEGSDDEDADDGNLLVTTTSEPQREGSYTFAFSDVRSGFYSGIQLMLSKKLYSTGHAHDFAEVICKQEELGTIVHCEGEDDVFAFATIVTASSVRHIEFFGRLVTFLRSNSSASTRPALSALEPFATDAGRASSYGLLLHDRFVNYPLELIPPLHRNLLEDLLWITNPNESHDDIAPELIRDFSAISTLVILRPCAAEESSSSSSSSSSGRVVEVTGSSSVMFEYFEDDVFFQHAVQTRKRKVVKIN